MAITALGPLVSGHDKNSGTVNLPLTPSRSVPVGRVLVAWVAWDSIFSVFQPTTGELQIRLYDTKGNVWCNIASAVDQGAFFNSGALAMISVTQVRNALTTGDTITATIDSSVTGITVARAVSIEEFDIGDGMRWCRAGGPWSHVLGGDPNPISFDASLTREWLFLHCLGNEGPSTDSFTWDSDYTEITPAGTTGGADDSNITVRGGYRIVTAQTDTVDVLNTTATRDNSQSMAAICGVKPRPGFPFTGVLDDFNRANEDPLDGGLWDASGPTAFGSSTAELVSNRATGGGGSFFLGDLEGCAEVYATVYRSTVESAFVALSLHAQGNAAAANMSQDSIASWVTNLFNQHYDAIFFANQDSNQGAPLGHLIPMLDAVDGYKFGIQRVKISTTNYVNHLWVDIGSGWEEIAAMLAFTVQNSGRLALGINQGAKADDFGGGEIPCASPFIPQIYRRVLGVA